ncbi:putative adenylate kinase 7, mitochondrial [Glycine max]|uniref:adenylate kinase n=2 Tax=Glycine subgen. Soja TaxID=1462606 RepID=K7K357_SOYBN|nr:hypothetical protein JHK85_001365 [Glycine max]KAH1162618.1 hypothetical protein GYH30_001208 [Glycine max]KAH1265801.1 putative adenylate kinase 7, mitochondrial [Glycine max]KHN26244.1 Adenylate kinase, chloroplastic [Glycine soja]
MQIAHSLDHGKLVPDDIIFGLLSKRLEDGYSRGQTGFILDGFPRTRIQAEILDHIAHVDLVLNFKFRRGLNEKESRNSKFNAYQEYILMTSSRTTKQLEDDHDQSHAKECNLLEDYYRKQKKLLNFEVAK